MLSFTVVLCVCGHAVAQPASLRAYYVRGTGIHSRSHSVTGFWGGCPGVDQVIYKHGRRLPPWSLEPLKVLKIRDQSSRE